MWVESSRNVIYFPEQPNVYSVVREKARSKSLEPAERVAVNVR